MTKKATPIIQQYLDIKKQHNDKVLFFRMGDFYEMFFEDAINISKVLNITLTKKGTYDDKDIPMCGIPFHSSEIYASKLIRLGYKVAICEQLETPQEAKKRGSTALVKRDVVRILTPGTVIEEGYITGNGNNYICALTKIENEINIAWADISTREFYCETVSEKLLIEKIFNIEPSELFITQNLYETNEIKQYINENNIIFDIIEKSSLNYENSLNKLQKYQNYYNLQTIDKNKISTAGIIVNYIISNNPVNTPVLKNLQIISNNQYLNIDPSTAMSLELIKSNSTQSTLLIDIINKTKTAFGSRLLKKWISMPLICKNEIINRQQSVDEFISNFQVCNSIRTHLNKINDIERILSRIFYNPTPRDTLNFAKSFEQIFEVKSYIQTFKTEIILDAHDDIIFDKKIIDDITKAINPEAPNHTRDSNFINDGFNTELDEIRNFKNNSHLKIIELEKKYAQVTGVDKVKIKFNNMIGFFIEVPSKFVDLFLQNEIFTLKQSMANNSRFYTDELNQIGLQITNSNVLELEKEKEIINEISSKIKNYNDQIINSINAISIIDIISNFAFISSKEFYTKPKFIETGLNIKKGFHPVVKTLLAAKNNDTSFIPNDCDMMEKNIHIITGPNMAGKSTYLRQNAIIIIMAQIGCYVPATSCELQIFDKIFSRIGSNDNISKGQSTFMVEMIEAANILKNSSSRSFCIIDEIGRGTSTYDGLSIAWSMLEYINNHTKSSCLFATHYHELSVLESAEFPNIKNMHLSASEWGEDIIFQHEIKEGSANKSYGIHVAKLAGMPQEIINRSNEILQTLEQDKNDQKNIVSNLHAQNNKIDKILENIKVNSNSPIEDFETLKNLINNFK